MHAKFGAKWCVPNWSCGWYLTKCHGHNQININLTKHNVLFVHTEQVLWYRIFKFLFPRMLGAILTYLSSQLPFLDAIWRGGWYLTNGSGHNQIKINLTTLNNIFSYIRQILSYGIFNFRIPRMLEAFWGVSEWQLPFWDATDRGILHNKWERAQTL